VKRNQNNAQNGLYKASTETKLCIFTVVVQWHK